VGRHVRRENDVVHRQERAVRRQGFRIVDIEAGAGDPALLQRARQRRRVDDRPARSVDQKRAGLHRLQRHLTDQAAGLRDERRVNRDEIALRQQRRKIDLAGAEFSLRRRIGQDVVVDDRHPQPASRHLGQATTDAAETDQAERLSQELGADQAVAGLPVARANGPIGRAHLLGQDDHHPQALLRHRLDVGLGGVHHGDAELRRRLSIDRLDTDAMPRHDFEPGGGLRQAAADLAVGPDDDPVDVADCFSRSASRLEAMRTSACWRSNSSARA
jgi:hypothetical protein